MSTRPRHYKVARAIALTAGYLGLLTWLTWPLAMSLQSSLPAEGVAPFVWRIDLYYSVWVLAHGSQSLVGLAAPFADANIYHPAANTLFYGPAGLGALPLFAPVYLASGNPGLAMNITFLLGLALTGVAMHEAVRHWTDSDLAGVVGATTVLFNQWLVRGFVPTAPHWAALFCFPLIAFLAAARLGSLRSYLLLTALVVFQCLTDLVYIAPVVLGPLGLLVAVRLTRPSTRRTGLQLAAALMLALLLLAPVYYGYLAVVAANPDIATQSKWANSLRVPTVLPNQLFSGQDPFILTPIFLALISLGCLALVLRRREGTAPPLPGGWAHGALWAIVGGTLAFGPLVRIGGEVFTAPLGLLTGLAPSLDGIRVANRLGVAGLIGLGILAGVAFGEITGRIRAHVGTRPVARVFSGVLAAAVVALTYHAYARNFWTFFGPEKMPGAYALQPAPASIPDSFLPILESSKAPLLELPAGLGTEPPAPHALAMYHSIAHGHPILNGYSSYWPAGFNERMTEAERLPARDALDRLVQATDLSLIWVHNQSLKPEQRSAWGAPPAPEAGRRGLVLVAREGPEMLFEVRPALDVGVVQSDQDQ